MLKKLRRMLRDKNGATAIEYALVASMISFVIITSVQIMGSTLNVVFDAVVNNLAKP
jgi:pilus assembly protein Flp/PilA